MLMRFSHAHEVLVELWCWERVDREKNSLILEGQTAALYTQICQETRVASYIRV
jgi:hypothetical protein